MSTSTDVHHPPAWMFDADDELMKPELALREELHLTDDQWSYWWAVWDYRSSARSTGKGGVKINGTTGDPGQQRWIDVVDALINLERLDAGDRTALLRSEWIKYAGCPGCGSSGGFVRRDKSRMFDRGQVRVSCGRRCRTRDVLAELGIETLPDVDALVADWLDSVPAEVDRETGEVTATASGSGGTEVPPEPRAGGIDPLDVEREAQRLRTLDAARDKVAAEKAGVLTLAPLVRLRDFLAVPDEDATYRVAALWPTGGRVMLSAQHKAGKTTMVGNLLPALVDGTRFLDTYEVQQATRVILVDNELDQRMLRRWLRDHGTVNDDRVEVLPLRGRLSSFNILDPATRSAWAKHIGPADVLIFDCLRPALDALGLSEDKEAGRFLEALDELCHEAGIGESLTVHHMGHTGERSRGDSRILDWPDAVWKLVKDTEGDDSAPGSVARYFTAYGRDVDVAEQLLTFDPSTRHLTIGGGSRLESKIEAAIDAVLDVLRDNGTPLSGRAVELALQQTDHGQKRIRAALKRLTADGRVLTEDGPRNATLHYLNPSECVSASSASPVRQRTEDECVSASIEDALHSTRADAVRQEEDRRTQTTSGPWPVCSCGRDIYDHDRDKCGACISEGSAA